MSFMQEVLGIAKDIKSVCTKFAVRELAEGVVKLTWLGEGISYVALLNLGGTSTGGGPR